MTRPPVPTLLRRAPAVLVGIAAILLCVSAGVSAATNGFDAATLLRIGLVLGGLLVVVWMGRFEFFLLAVLVVRPVLDIAKVGGGPAVLSSGVAALVVLGVLLWLAAQLHGGTLRRVSVLGQLSVLLLAVMTVSAVFSGDQVRSLLQVARLAAAVAVFLAVEQFAVAERNRRRVLTAVYVSAVVPLLVGLQQFATGTYLKQSSGLGRVTGTFLHPNAFGFYLVLLLIMGTAIFRYLQGGPRLLVGAVVAVGSVELLLTYSRGSWATVVAGVLVVGVLQSRKLLLLVPAGLALVVVLAPSVLTRLSDLSQEETINGTPGNSFLWRVQHWGVVLEGAQGHEFLGLGPSASDYLGAEVLPPHNDFVRMYVETGVLGTTVYLAVIVAALAMALRALRAVPDGRIGRGVAVGAAGCTAAFVLGSFGGNLISEVVVLLYLFTFFALATSLTLHPPQPALRPPRHAPAHAMTAGSPR
ncbi:O-antigen ligase [Modestobacter sp. DSM 44400]|uniref:O-antigen ligase family protein n=1 Tax=Modestobacter sp. DSM 44400 TaxID=1550230 RepID=UPI00089B4FCC|nr:O-antigen ligase family protein [Modestobacter sp. DSM 44400]SDY66910.1 O-antigen ligase [Modestobacter sp. DSM 44400]